MSAEKHKRANEAYEMFRWQPSCWNRLYAWCWAELECDGDAMRTHGHHDQDVLEAQMSFKRVVALATGLYNKRQLPVAPQQGTNVVRLNAAA